MSSHSHFDKWVLADEIPEGFIEDITHCVWMNVKIQPLAFAIGGWADQIVWVLTSNLIADPILTNERIEELAQSVEDEMSRDRLIHVMKTVRDRLFVM